MRFKFALKALLFGLGLAAGLVLPVHSETTTASSAQARTEAHFRLVRSQPPLLWAFLKDMPKGGDLHNHLAGAIYAESMIAWAAEDGLCVDSKTLVATKAVCDEAQGQVAVKNAQTDPLLYRRMIDAWSMRNPSTSGLSGHDLFFDSFDKFRAATQNREGDMLAEVASRASAGRVSYLELMHTPALADVFKVAVKTAWTDNLGEMRAALIKNGLPEAIQAAANELSRVAEQQRNLMHCDTAQAASGCEVTVRYLYQVLRGLPKEVVFTQMLVGFELVQRDSRVVGLNLVMPEDALVPMRDFSLHMRLLDHLHGLYPQVQVTLHAGELVPGLVPPEGLRFHIRDSMDLGHAKRIGHGVAVMQEEDATGLLKKMARSKTLVEICLTSNTGILGVTGAQHPLSAYLKYGVPVALATDDEGVSRSEMTQEYVKAVQEQHIDYRQLKNMARNSLHYAFVEGSPVWQDLDRLRPVTACAGHPPGAQKTSAQCRAYLEHNPKARLQWDLEEAFVKFERRF